MRNRSKIKKALGVEFTMLDHMVVEVENIHEMSKLLDWDNDPLVGPSVLDDLDSREELDLRRLHDAELVSGVMANLGKANALEIGTSEGRTTALMAESARTSTIYTMNASPRESERCQRGSVGASAFGRHDIGTGCCEPGCENIREICADPATWKPDIGTIGAVFIDGCYQAEFVYSNTCKVLSVAAPGAIILWQDFSLPLAHSYHSIYETCVGLEELCQTRRLRGKIYHLRDSWVGLYRVPLDE